MRGIVAFLAVLILFSTPALAERRVALVMGADAYRSLRPLDNAVNDALAIRDALEALGFEVTLETDRTLRRMRGALKDFREDAAGADVALLFFAGHGMEVAGHNRLLPVDADPASLEALERSTLPLEEARAALASVSKVALVVLDACRNDPFAADPKAGRGAMAIGADIDSAVRPGLGRVGRAENVLFAFAAAPGETASDGDDGNSPFTAALARYLATDGLEIRSVLTLVQQEVYDRTRGRQLPYVESGLPRLFFASPDGATLPERERLLLAMADVTPELRLQVEAVAASNDMPLAPLYGALLESGGGAGGSEETAARLQSAADAFVAVREQLRKLGAADPEVARLRGEAERQLALGAFDAARARLAEAAGLDSRSRQALKANFVERTLSEAATRLISGGAARAALRYRLAIGDYEQALALYDEVGDAALAPEHADRRLAALETLGLLHETAGDVTAARDAYESLRHWAARRAQDDPDPSIRRDLAKANARLGDTLVALGDLDAALDAYGEARDLLAQLTALPAGAPWLRDLATVEDGIGNARLSRGELQAALDAYGESLRINLQRVKEAPDDPDRLRDLTVSYDELGDVLRVMGDLAAARQAFEASLAIRERLLADDPEGHAAQRNVSVSRDKIGDVLRDMGEAEDALASYRRALVIVQAMADRDPDNTQLVRDIGVGGNKIGNVLRDMDDLDGAESAFGGSLAVMRTLAARDPANTQWQRDLSVTLEKLADIARLQGETAAALAGYEESLPITRRLAARDPGNAEWQRDLSITLAEIGNLRLDLGDRSAGQEALAECLEMREALAASEPDNALWQHDLVIANVDYARVAREPAAHLAAALDIARALDRSGRLPPRDRAMIGRLEHMLAKVKSR